MYKITSITPESVLNYEVDEYSQEGDYLILLYDDNKHLSIINLTKMVSVDIERVGNE